MESIAQRCDFSTGERIDGKYHVKEVLGEGAFGKVFKVKDQAGQFFALKLLRLWEVHPEIRQQLVARFDMEYETGRIKSNYLVHSVDHGSVKGNPYIVMEYCSNGDLTQYINKEKSDFVKIGRETLYGLRDLHSNGKVHRDLKPENVLIRADGTAVLTDFGISGDRNNRMTRQNMMGKPTQIFGTYAYMPPEQMQPQKRDATVLPTTDIFSFGVMMFQLITGKLPFGQLEKEDHLVIYIKNGREGKWDEQRLSSSTKGTLFTPVIQGCLKPDYKQRLQSVDDVLELMPDHAKRPSYPNKPLDTATIKNGLLLRVMQGEEYGKIYRLNTFLHHHCSVITVGRKDISAQNTISIAENQTTYISRKHCTLEMDDATKQWYIRDGQWDGGKNSIAGSPQWRYSVNGTFVNSTEVPFEGMPISPGDIISIGDVKLRVEGY